MRLRRSRLTEEQSERLLEHYVAATPARAAAALVGVNRNTARLYYHRLREIIAQQLARESPQPGEIVADVDNLAGNSRRKGARRATARVPVFGLYASNGKVHTVLLRDEQAEAAPVPPPAPAPTVEPSVRLDAIVYADSTAGRGALDVSAFHHQRVDEARRYAQGRPQIDNIESFWSQCKRHLRRYNGIPRHNFHLFLKECEWRFNYGSPAQLLKVLKGWIKTP
jgi:transposase